MRFTSSVCLALLVVLATLARADSIDDAQLKADQAEAKKRGVAVEVVQLENARKQIAVLKERVGQLEAQVQPLKATVGKLTKERDALLAKAKIDGEKTTVNASLPETTIKKLNVMGEELTGKAITTPVVIFVSTETDTDHPNAVKFFVRDTEENGSDMCQDVYASKKDFADLLLRLKRGQKIRITGTVYKDIVSYGIICKSIEEVKDDATTKPAH